MEALQSQVCGETRKMKNTNAKSVTNALPPVHPGEILAEDFLSPLGMSARALAAAIGVTPARVSDIIAGRRELLDPKRGGGFQRFHASRCCSGPRHAVPGSRSTTSRLSHIEVYTA